MMKNTDLDILKVLPFIKEIDRLKQVERQTLIHSGGRRENTAEHSWHLAMSVLVLQGFAPQKIDVSKAVLMALLHDIVEIYAGDTFVYADLSQKQDKEILALNRLLELAPDFFKEQFRDIWHEFEAGESPEAKYVQAIDRFLPLYSNYLHDGYSWQNHSVPLSKVKARTQKPISEGIPQLWLAVEKMLEESVERKQLDPN